MQTYVISLQYFVFMVDNKVLREEEEEKGSLKQQIWPFLLLIQSRKYQVSSVGKNNQRPLVNYFLRNVWNKSP